MGRADAVTPRPAADSESLPRLAAPFTAEARRRGAQRKMIRRMMRMMIAVPSPMYM